MNRNWQKYFPWGLSYLVVILAVIAWGSDLNWNFSRFSNYKLFPLLGLLLFSLVWSLYVITYLSKRRRLTKIPGGYYKIVSGAVLLLLFLHPGLLVYQLWRDGYGLPPGSYWNNYVAPAARWAVVISGIAFFVFLAYELRFKFRGKSWWKYVEAAGDLAMVGLFFHALRLGHQLQHGWFRWVWFFYGVVLGWILISNYYRLAKKNIV